MPAHGQKRKSTQVKAESPYTIGADDESVSHSNSPSKKCRLSTSAQTDEPTPLSADASGDLPLNDAPHIEIDPCATQATSQKIAKKFTRHETYWLLDGNTFVQIGNTRFKLHQSTLVKHSKWFRYMIENEAHDRCIYADEETGALVYVLDSLEVNLKDFVALLNALDNAISYTDKCPPFKFIASILRAADALDFEQFRAFAISYLERKWPDDLSTTTWLVGYAAESVLLARRCNISSILRCALYELVRTEGFKQSETDPDGAEDEDQPTLSTSDFSLLLRTREQLTIFWMQKAIPPPQPTTCKSPENSPAHTNCAMTKHRTHELYQQLVHDTKLFEINSFDPISGLADLYANVPWVHGEAWPPDLVSTLKLPTAELGSETIATRKYYLCSACAKEWRAVWEAEQIKVWNDLKTWFELDNGGLETGDGEE